MNHNLVSLAGAVLKPATELPLLKKMPSMMMIGDHEQRALLDAERHEFSQNLRTRIQVSGDTS